MRPERPHHLWSYDFVEHRIHKGRPYRMLNVIDALSDLFSLRGMPDHIRSDNGPEFIAKAVQDRIAATGSKTAYITLKAASVVIEQQRSHDNSI